MRPINDDTAEDFEDFFEHALCGYVIADPNGKIIRGNARLAEWTGLTVEELKGKRFSGLLSIGGKIYYETHLWPLLKIQGFFEEVSLELACKKDERLQVLVNAYDRRNNEGKSQFVRLTIYKATDRQVYEQNLRSAKTLAEQDLSQERKTSKLREQFIAVLGHDLRNPLSAIISGVTLLSNPEQTVLEKRLVAMIKSSSSRMSELIENVMDFARGRLGGGMSVDLKPIHLEPVLLHVVEELRTSWKTRTIETYFDIAATIFCDAARISQLLSNLVANALTHGSPTSPVSVRAVLTNGLFELSVTNTGKPISPEALHTLFEPFTREDVSPSQNGLGLGLYIASEIARAHKGELTATSTETETVFKFVMPSDSK